jgi:phosphoserine aminotransferase
MISFYPGPSRIYDEVPQYVKDAHKQGILSINHRSEEFMKMSEKTIKLLKEKLNIPKNYTVLYTTSATECWEIIAQSLITDKSYHLYNGAFGQKWYDYTKRINPVAMPLPFGMDEKLNPDKLIFDQHEGVVCLTQNETSNGTQISNSIIKNIKKNNPNYLIAVDATSSMGGIKLDFKAADLWFASIQKCFGLPAGLGLLICSPQTIERAKILNEKKHYNSLPFMISMMDNWQTPFTPNVMAIYLLMRVLEKADAIDDVHNKLEKQYYSWSDFLNQRKNLKHLVENSAVHSFTVLPVKSTPTFVEDLKKKAKKAGFLLGEGYGEFKSSTFRVANFPALKSREIADLKSFLKVF